MTALVPSFPAISAVCPARIRAHGAFTRTFTHSFAHSFTHSLARATHSFTFCTLFLRRSCHRGNFPSFSNLRRFGFSHRNRPRAKARMPARIRRKALGMASGSGVDGSVRRIKELRVELQWRAWCPGHKKTLSQLPNGEAVGRPRRLNSSCFSLQLACNKVPELNRKRPLSRL
jgi:hypothetical protein